MQFRRAPSSCFPPARFTRACRCIARGALAAAIMPMLAAGATAAPVTASGEAAVAVDPSLFAALQWRGIGPYRGGRALAVAGIPGDPATFYFGAVAGGVWKTTDGGATLACR